MPRKSYINKPGGQPTHNRNNKPVNMPRNIYLPYNIDLLSPGRNNGVSDQYPRNKKYNLADWLSYAMAQGWVSLPPANTITSIVLNHVDAEPDTLEVVMTMTDGSSFSSNIVVTLDDQDASQVSFTPCDASMTSTNVQDAICELLTLLNNVGLEDNGDGTVTFTDANGNTVTFNAG